MNKFFREIASYLGFNQGDNRAKSLLNEIRTQSHYRKGLIWERDQLVKSAETNVFSYCLSLTELRVPKTLSHSQKSSTNSDWYSAVIIQNLDGEILLLKRDPNDSFYPSTWCLPSGEVEMNEDCLEAAMRECYEETKLNPPIIRLLHKEQISENSTIFYHYCVLTSDYSEVILDKEHCNYGWFSEPEWSEMELILDLKSHLRSALSKVQTNKYLESIFQDKFNKDQVTLWDGVRNKTSNLSEPQFQLNEKIDQLLELGPEAVSRMKYSNALKNNLGRRRHQMPQIDDSNIQEFLDHFNYISPGTTVTETSIHISEIKIAQMEVDQKKVLNLLKEDFSKKDFHYIVSEDNYLIDGTHRFCAQLEQDDRQFVLAYKINLPGKELLRRANLLSLTYKKDINDKVQKSLVMDYGEFMATVKKLSKGESPTDWSSFIKSMAEKDFEDNKLDEFKYNSLKNLDKNIVLSQVERDNFSPVVYNTKKQ